MAMLQWPLRNGRPVVQVVLTLTDGQSLVRDLVADTGAGTRDSVFDLILDEDDCLHCGGVPADTVRLGGAYVGSFPVYFVDVRIPELGFDQSIAAVAVSQVPLGFGGIACFKFLRRFNYGDMNDPDRFCLESLACP